MKNFHITIPGAAVFVFCFLLFEFVSCAPLTAVLETIAVPSATSLALEYTETPPEPSPSQSLLTLTPLLSDTISIPSATPSPVPSVTPTSEPEERLSSYTLLVTLDYDAHWLEVVQELEYVNNTSVALNEILFLVEPNRYSDVFQLNALSLQDFESEEIQYELEGRKLLLQLPEELLPGQSLVFKFSYELFIPFQQDVFGYSTRQINLADWYLMVPPYDPQTGWMVYEPASVGEHLLYDLADFWVEIQLVPTGTWPLIAAPALAEQNGSTFLYQKNSARNFTWSASPDYQVLPAYAQNTLILGYVFSEHVEAGQDAVEYVRQALEAYNEIYGYYPLECMTVIESDFPDGMEYDGLFFLNKAYFTYYPDSPSSGLCALSAHETAHQWWYRVVANNQALEPWMDEALCTYTELMFYEYYYPELADWWWQYRIDDFSPSGWVDSTIYTTSEYRPYVNAVYLQGVRFMDAVRDEIGKEAFLAALSQYAADFQYSIAAGSDLLELLGPSETVLQQYFSTPTSME